MNTYTLAQAKNNLTELVDSPKGLIEPVIVKGKKHSAVIVSEEEWKSIQETLYVTSIPGMKESLIEGMKTDISECTEELNW